MTKDTMNPPIRGDGNREIDLTSFREPLPPLRSLSLLPNLSMSHMVPPWSPPAVNPAGHGRRSPFPWPMIRTGVAEKVPFSPSGVPRL